MGNTSSLNCCVDNNSQPHELVTILPSKILIVQAYQQQKITPIKHNICKTSFLSELDYYLSKAKNSKNYSDTFVKQFGSFQDVLDLINYEQNLNWDIPMQTKTYNLQQNRFDNINNSIYPSQFGVLMLDKNYQYSAIFNKCNLRKIQLLLLQKNFSEYEQHQYITSLYTSLYEWQGLSEYIWMMEKNKSYGDTSRQLLYHLSRYISFVNSELSINDIVSLMRVKYLYHYFLNQIANANHELLHPRYCFDNWVHETQVHMLRIGKIITLHNFTQFKPYVQEQVYQNDVVRLDPPKGDEEITKIKIRFIVQPLVTTKLGVKFRYYEYLYYLPFCMFAIDKIEQKHGRLYFYLKELESQKIVQFIASNTKGTPKPAAKSKKDDILNDLSQFRSQYAKGLQQLSQKQPNEIKQILQLYYQRYIKNRVNVIISQQQLPVLSKRQLQICDDEIKQKIEEQTTPHLQIDSQLEEIHLSPQQIALHQKQLDRYIKNNNLQKLQSQIDNVHSFTKLTSLNISQSWLEKLECLHCFPNLVELFACKDVGNVDSNLIKKIEGLNSNINLRVLSLARNDIAVLDNIEHLTHLRELYVTKNKLDLTSAAYLSSLPLPKLKILTISFKEQSDECFQVLMRRPPPLLKKIVINQGDLLTNRTRNTLKRRLRGVQIHFIHA